MRIFKNAWFYRFARREGINDTVIKDAIVRAEKGIIDADLGGGVIKQRIARPGQGKSGGYRSIILFRRGEKAFFVYGYAKSDLDNIDQNDLADFKKAAKYLFSLSEKELTKLLEDKELMELL